MSILHDYRDAAPFTAKQLVDATNAILRYKDTPEFSLRTLRYYISQKVIARPRGAPKFARYDYEHLLAIVATRMLQDQGTKLEKILSDVSEIKSGKVDKWEKIVTEWLSVNRRMPTRGIPAVKESRAAYGKDVVKLPGLTIKRIEVSSNCVIEIDDRVDPVSELKKARTRIEAILKTVDK